MGSGRPKGFLSVRGPAPFSHRYNGRFQGKAGVSALIKKTLKKTLFIPSLLAAVITSVVLINAQTQSSVRFIDVARQSGLTVPNVFGGKDKKEFILESTGTGVAI